MPQIGTPERRRARRVRAHLPVTLEARDAGAPARLKDISSVGLCCTFPESIPEMTLVRVRVEIESEEHELEGAVVRCEQESDDAWEIAVYFTNIADTTRGHIEELVEAHVPRGTGT